MNHMMGKYGNRLPIATGPFTTDGYKGFLSHDHRGFTADGHMKQFRSLQERQTCILHGNVCNGTFAETSHATFRSYSTEAGEEDEHDKEIIVLPYGSKQDVYQKYIEAHGKDLHIEYKTFLAIWEQEKDFSHVITKDDLEK